jgi:hypothetical protein
MSSGSVFFSIAVRRAIWKTEKDWQITIGLPWLELLNGHRHLHAPTSHLLDALAKSARELQHSDRWFRGKSPEGFVTLRARSFSPRSTLWLREITKNLLAVPWLDGSRRAWMVSFALLLLLKPIAVCLVGEAKVICV